MYLRFSFLVLVLLLTAGVALASPADSAPPWLQQAAALPVPAYDKDVPGVVLRLEENIVVNNDGRLTTSTYLCGAYSYA